MFKSYVECVPFLASSSKMSHESFDCSIAKVSPLETGKGSPRLVDIRALLRLYEADHDAEERLLRLVSDGRAMTWWEEYVRNPIRPERFVLDRPGEYGSYEAEAACVKTFDLVAVHGLLQIEEYTRAILLSVLANRHASDIDRLVELRLARQKEAFAQTRPPLRLEAVIDESVLMRISRSPLLAKSQLAALLERAASPDVSVKVLPLSAGVGHRGLMGHFVILQFDGDIPDVVYTEGQAGSEILTTPSDVKNLKDTYQSLSDLALNEAASFNLIREYLEAAGPAAIGR